MIYAGIVLSQLILLFFLGKHLKNAVFTFFFLLTKSKKWAISFFSLLFFPGTVVHELAHLISATILLVGVGDMELVPKVKDGKVRAGSVQIAKTDFIRRTIIGIAPIFAGIAIIWLISSHFIQFKLPASPAGGLFTVYDLRFTSFFNFAISQFPFFEFSQLQFTIYDLLFTNFTIYLIFSISNMMYSSRKDLESLIYAVPFGIIITALLYLIGFNFTVVQNLLESFSQFFISLSWLLAMVILVNAGILVFFLLLTKLIRVR